MRSASIFYSQVGVRRYVLRLKSVLLWQFSLLEKSRDMRNDKYASQQDIVFAILYGLNNHCGLCGDQFPCINTLIIRFLLERDRDKENRSINPSIHCWDNWVKYFETVIQVKVIHCIV